MKYLADKQYRFKNPILTMGNFDGIHIGHHRLLELMARRASEIGGESIVLTYYHHPFETLHKQPYPYLLTEKDKKEFLIREIGIDHVFFLKFDDVVANMSAEQFLKDVLTGQFNPVEIFVGYDTHFGRNRSGDYRFLKDHESEYGYVTHHIPPVKCSGQIVSSSLVRKCISEGLMEEASGFLGRCYSIEGIIVHGQGIGKTIGYPTINIKPLDPHKLIPRQGIYLTTVRGSGDRELYGLTNIGFSPTLKNMKNIEIETYILDFAGDLYDERIELCFIQRIRDEIMFTTKEDLQNAIASDVEFARKKIPMIKEG